MPADRPLQLCIEPTRVPCRCCASCAEYRDDEQRKSMMYQPAANATEKPCRFCGRPTFGTLMWNPWRDRG